MQINKLAVETPKTYTNNNRQPLNINSKQSFGNFDSFIVNTMEAISRGGLFAEFEFPDMIGTNLPRPLTGLFRNKKEMEGKKNTTFALKEAIREFTTGPSMFIIPGVMLAVVKKTVGKALNVPVDYINGFSEIYKKAPLTEAGEAITRQDFFTNVFKNILGNSTKLSAEELQTSAAELAKDLIKAENAPKKSGWKHFKGIFVEGSQQDLMQSLSDKFTNIIKSSSSSPLADYTVGTMDIGVNGTKTTAPFKTIITRLQDYADDVVEKTTKMFNIQTNKPTLDKVADYISSTNTKRIAGRFAMNLAMIGAVLGFLSIVPSLYNVSKDNPALRGLEKPVNGETTKKGEN